MQPYEALRNRFLLNLVMKFPFFRNLLRPADGFEQNKESINVSQILSVMYRLLLRLHNNNEKRKILSRQPLTSHNTRYNVKLNT